MPSPDQAMFINLYTNFSSKKSGEKNFNTVSASTLIGPQITPFKLVAEENHIAVSIIFQPGGLNRFLNFPLSELFDNGYNAREVIGKEIEELVSKSYDTKSINDLNAVIQNYLLTKLAKLNEQGPIDFALQYLANNHNTSLDKITSMACMSLRSFERKCKERLGMSAKMYARITRFYKAYKLMEPHREFTWTNICYELGYYDQNHFIKDFKEFALFTPTIIQKEIKNGLYQFQLDWEKS